MPLDQARTIPAIPFRAVFFFFVAERTGSDAGRDDPGFRSMPVIEFPLLSSSCALPTRAGRWIIRRHVLQSTVTARSSWIDGPPSVVRQFCNSFFFSQTGWLITPVKERSLFPPEKAPLSGFPPVLPSLALLSSPSPSLFFIGSFRRQANLSGGERLHVSRS